MYRPNGNRTNSHAGTKTQKRKQALSRKVTLADATNESRRSNSSPPPTFQTIMGLSKAPSKDAMLSARNRLFVFLVGQPNEIYQTKLSSIDNWLIGGIARPSRAAVQYHRISHELEHYCSYALYSRFRHLSNPTRCFTMRRRPSHRAM